MKIGASTKAFGGKSTREVAELFGENGLSAIELCFCQNDLSGFRYNLYGSADLPDINGAKKAKEIYESFGVDVCAIGVYCNFWQGTDSEIFDTLRVFTSYCDLACALGVRTLSTHTGSTFVMPTARGFNEKLREKLYYGFTYAVIEAHKRGLELAVELGENDAIRSYAEFLKLKDYTCGLVGANNVLKCICSPALTTDIPKQEISLYHLKDRKNGEKFYGRFGEGNLNFAEFFDTFPENKDIPVILEYVNSENLGETVNRFRGAVAGKQ